MRDFANFYIVDELSDRKREGNSGYKVKSLETKLQNNLAKQLGKTFENITLSADLVALSGKERAEAIKKFETFAMLQPDVPNTAKVILGTKTEAFDPTTGKAQLNIIDNAEMLQGFASSFGVLKTEIVAELPLVNPMESSIDSQIQNSAQLVEQSETIASLHNQIQTLRKAFNLSLIDSGEKKVYEAERFKWMDILKRDNQKQSIIALLENTVPKKLAPLFLIDYKLQIAENALVHNTVLTPEKAAQVEKLVDYIDRYDKKHSKSNISKLLTTEP